ncbi:Cu/Zn superoxide dismutase [Halobacteroides halobius DSM 5150]|uniref:Superoxide dismutase [Cu-Zn] n=1 Tax=Halobacteroides halobius (strain ATCC 35273 / DSM 5150 / MD-1) TaxID=748449 RepID=L0K7N8_HALHC|nr:superoxide dismutase family protein [Halobacteroides halobius]AGB40359.1 Cu/Zn superoxide dismutase [Halobacteroides halobius DSM 5150]
MNLLKRLFLGLSKVACAKVIGGPLAPKIEGRVYFREVSKGTIVTVRISGLPSYQPGEGGKDPIGPHGFHVHERGNCEVGDPEDPFQAAGGHYNPHGEPHGNHAGDLPNLFSNNGVARMQVFTNEFQPEDIIGRAVIIHQNPDDFRTQPAGDAGKRLACGIIKWC